MKLSEIKARQESIAVEIQAIGVIAKDESRDLTEQEVEQVNGLQAESDKLDEEKVKAEKLEKAMAAIVSAKLSGEGEAAQPTIEQEEIPVAASVPVRVKSQRTRNFDSAEGAYEAGMYFAALGGSQKAQQFLADQSIGTDNKGGFTVPTPLSNALINLLESYGVARQACRRIVMSAETWTVPKVAGHATVYYPAEAGAITASDMTFEQVQLVASKIAALVKMSTEVVEDSIVSIMDTVVQDIAYAVAIAEDENLFNGVAGGINASGIKGDAGVNDTNVASVAALALDDLTAATVGIGNPIVGARNEWFMNSTLFHGPIRDLVNAAGGNTISDLEGGQRPSLLGYPVNFVSVLPGSSASASGDLLAVFGDMSLGYYFGDRRSLSFKMLNELYAENDQVGVVATERIDIKSANPEVLSKITLT